jgi:hypothetical protein
MNIIITERQYKILKEDKEFRDLRIESKLVKLGIKWLNDDYGDLEPYETDKYPNHILYKKDNQVIFDYNKQTGFIYVDFNKVWYVFKRYFSMDYQQIQNIITLWLEERYNLRVTNMQYKQLIGLYQLS